MNKRILYLMHTPWGWIKQRPHFLAEGLRLFFNITIACNCGFSLSSDLTKNTRTIPIIELRRLPLERFNIIWAINNLIRRFQLRNVIRDNDVIWVTHPLLLSWIPKKYRNKDFIYDCMDDAIEFKVSKKTKALIIKQEKFIYTQAKLVICSAEYLKQKLIKRYGERDILVVNNALKNIERSSEKLHKLTGYNNSSFKVLYFGTISSWFDFNLINKILSTIDNVEFFLYGPSEVPIPKNERIHFYGPVEHKYINSLMTQADLLIMPFVINELIRSVNPVKLYEYISSGKPSLAPRYQESEKFEDYVYLYDTPEECICILNDIINGKLNNKKSQKECMLFAMNNTWDNRVNTIKDNILYLMK